MHTRLMDSPGRQTFVVPRPGGPPRFRRLRLVAAVAAVSLGLAGSVHFAQLLHKPDSVMLPAATVAAPPAAQPPAGARLSGPVLPRSIPTHLAIPDVGIDTALVSVGLNPDKTLEVPADYLEAGWYKYSPTPGEVGPAVIVGHLDSVAAIGVFWELHNVQVGDKIMVTRADGQTHTFVATGIRQVSKDEFPTADIYGNINYAGLRLLTCGGVYDIAKHEYNLNTVVFAKLVS